MKQLPTRGGLYFLSLIPSALQAHSSQAVACLCRDTLQSLCCLTPQQQPAQLTFLFYKHCWCPSYLFFFSNSCSVAYGEGNGTPLQYSCLENPMDGGAWWVAVHGVAESRTQLSDFSSSLICYIRNNFACFVNPRSLRSCALCLLYTIGGLSLSPAQMTSILSLALYLQSRFFSGAPV